MQPQVAIADPPNDGSAACYEQARLPFYHAANTALLVDQDQAQTRQNGALLTNFGRVVELLSNGMGGVSGQLGRSAGVAAEQAGALLASAQTDQRIIADVSSTFRLLVQCRQDEAGEVRRDVRQHRVRPAEGRERLRALHDLMATDADVARRVNADLAQRNQVYALAASKIETDLPADPVQRQKRLAEVTQAKQTIQSSQHALTDQASLIDKASQTITVSAIAPGWVPI